MNRYKKKIQHKTKKIKYKKKTDVNIDDSEEPGTLERY